MSESNQNAPQIENSTMAVKNLTEKFNDFVAGKTTVVEFWENERQGGLCKILLSFSEDDKIPAVEKGEIRSIMSNIPAKLNAWKLANNINNQTQVSLLDGEIRQMYINALEILTSLLKLKQPSPDMSISKTGPIQAGQQRADQIIKVLKQLLLGIEKVSLLKSLAAKCVVDFNIPNNMPVIVAQAFQGTSDCDILIGIYEDLLKEIDTLVPPLRWDINRQKEAHEASEKINVLMREIKDGFEKIAEKKGKIKNDAGDLRDNYVKYCEITITELLVTKGI